MPAVSDGLSLSECYRINRPDFADLLQGKNVKWVCLMKRAHKALKRRPHHPFLKLSECVSKILSMTEDSGQEYAYHSAKGDVDAAGVVLRYLVVLEQESIASV